MQVVGNNRLSARVESKRCSTSSATNPAGFAGYYAVARRSLFERFEFNAVWRATPRLPAHYLRVRAARRISDSPRVDCL